MTDANYELIVIGGAVALVGKIVWDWLSKTRHAVREHTYIEEHYKVLGQVETELRKLNHAVANMRQITDILSHNIQELRDDIKELRS